MPNGDKEVGPVVASHEAKEPSEVETRKSAVRVLVTYIAAGFLFVVGAGFVAALLALDKVEDAKNVFLAILPVSAAVITFWFAGRNSSSPVDVIDAMNGVIDRVKSQNQNGQGGGT